MKTEMDYVCESKEFMPEEKQEDFEEIYVKNKSQVDKDALFCKGSSEENEWLTQQTQTNSGETDHSCYSPAVDVKDATLTKDNPSCSVYCAPIIIVSAIRHYTCTNCNMSFTNMRRLTAHQKLTHKINPNTCAICKKCFTYKSDLAAHQHVHTGIKPYTCTICNIFFIQSTHLTEHLKRAHRPKLNKPYTCVTCKKTYTEKGNLTRHQFIHKDISVPIVAQVLPTNHH